jgi:hypothetical protein
VTSIGGVLVDTISSGSDAFELSDNGRRIIFEATLEGGINGAFLIRIPEPGGPNEPPVALCKDVVVVADETCFADASIDAGSFDPDGDPITLSQSPPGPYPVGVTEVTLTVTDDKGASDSCTGTVTVVDENPPTISVVLDPEELWPPNHRLLDVHAIVTAADDCSTPTVELTSLSSDEPDNGEGDGNTEDDIREAEIGTDDRDFKLRAERAGGGDGRTYSAEYTATDSSGNTASTTATATTPHDKSGKTEPVDVSVEETPGGTLVDWNDVPGASYYNVIRGHLASIVETSEEIVLGTVVCVEAQTSSTDTRGIEDTEIPAPGEAFFYLVEYQDGLRSGYGTETAPKPRAVASGDCE